MHVRVLKCFALDGRICRPGIYEMTDALAADAGERVRAGVLVVFLDSPKHTLHLHTPEDGQHMTFR